MRVPIPPTALVAILLAIFCFASPVPVSAQAETQVAAVARTSPERARAPQVKRSKATKPSRATKPVKAASRKSGAHKAVAHRAAAHRAVKSPHMDPSRPCGGGDLVPYRQSGRAHFYGVRHQGQRTANGEEFDMRELTAAHLSLPFGTRVRVTNARNGRSVVVRINDRHARGTAKIIDLSRGAADSLGFRRQGVTAVRLAAVCG